MTTTLRLCCGREPVISDHWPYPADWKVQCGMAPACPASTAWHATAEGAAAEWNGREKQND